MEKVIRPKPFPGDDDTIYVEIQDFRGMGPAYLRLSDWEQLEPGEEKIFPLFEIKEGLYKPFQRLGGRKTGDNGLRIGGKENQILMEEVEEKKVVPKYPDEGQIGAWNQQAELLIRKCNKRMDKLEKQFAMEQEQDSRHLFADEDLLPTLEQAKSVARRQILDLKVDIQKTQHSYEEMGKG